MGGGSTSHSAVLSDKKAGAPPAFDLHSWQGLTQVLRLGKSSLTDPHAYAEFRNLVLEYAQKGGDAEVRKKIDGIIATFGEEGGTHVSAQGETITAPREVENIQTPVSVPQPILSSAEEKVSAPETPRPVPLSTRRLEPQFPLGQEKEIVMPAPAKETPKEELLAEVPPPVPAVSVAEKSPAPVPAPVPSPAVEASAPSDAGTFKTLDEYKARIAEIKRIVHARVGNPAMLIDTHNEEGKKYMQALLSALKATGGGSTQGVDSAMAALEAAYETLIESESVHQPEPESEEVEEPKAPPVRIHAALKEDPLPQAPQETKEEETPAEEIVTSRTEPLPSRAPQEKVIQQVDEKILTVMQGIQKERGEGSAYAPFYAKSSESPEKSGSQSPVGVNRYVLKGVGKRPLEEVKQESGVDPAEIVIKQTELSSPEITEALHQLLGEWNIFHGSGIFGMGPSGPEHPLYKTLAPLTMGEVIAGRWEGSNHKLTKTIKQYVDAWRHEQGIAYVISETFEHYLRRVVQRILKRQNAA